jgi:hypothetical protein
MISEDHVSIEDTLLMLDDATPHVAAALGDERGRT